MSRRGTRIGRCLALALASSALLGGCPPAEQAPPPAAPPAPPPPATPPPPSFPAHVEEGEISLLPGFAPSPYVVVGSTRAARAAREFNAPCPLYIVGPPQYFLDAPQGHQQLTLLVQSEAPAGLMLMGPQGGFLCSEGASGRIRNRFPPGRYAIWVGATMQGGELFYRLGFSEDASISAEALPSSIMGSWQAEGEAVTLAAALEPDPHVVQGTTRGVVSANELEPRCNGFFPEQPNHLFEVTTDLPRLKIMVRHNRDTSLIITDTRGRVWCEDDVEGRFPIIDDAFPAGHYRVFVATKFEGGTASYSLGFSTSDETTVQSLPRAPRPEP